MTEPGKTRHERMKHHLQTATKHLAAAAKASQAQAALHLEKNPVVPPAPTNTDGPTTTESSPDAISPT